MSYGFVYILGNDCMPDVIKIGCTEKAPHARAEELSRPTGVPVPFQVLCYAEFEDFQAIERNLHEWCKDFRVSQQREFFQGCTARAVSLLYFHPCRLAFVDATEKAGSYEDSDLQGLVLQEYQHTISDLPNPFGKRENEQERQEMLKRYFAGDFRRCENGVPVEHDPEDDFPFPRETPQAANDPPPVGPDRMPWEKDEPAPPAQEAAA